MLSQLDFPAHSRDDDDVLSEHDVQLLDVGDLLALRHPSRDPLRLVTTLTCTPAVLPQKIPADRIMTPGESGRLSPHDLKRTEVRGR